MNLCCVFVSADTILMEAQNLIALNSAQTPLKGGENTPLHQSDFTGATPAPVVVQTPNALLTPARAAAAGVGATPMRGGIGAAGATPSRTPYRDGLHINDSNAAGFAVPERVRLTATKQQVKSSLMSLPAPKNQFKVVISEEDESDDGAAFDGIQKAPAIRDSADIEAERLAAIKAKEDTRLRLRSQVLKVDLPRPTAFLKLASAPAPSDAPVEQQAIDLIQQELALILLHDASMSRYLPHDISLTISHSFTLLLSCRALDSHLSTIQECNHSTSSSATELRLQQRDRERTRRGRLAHCQGARRGAQVRHGATARRVGGLTPAVRLFERYQEVRCQDGGERQRPAKARCSAAAIQRTSHVTHTIILSLSL